MKLSKKLITWYLQHKRSMPWRETNDPYPIWLSEIILQQTRVSQGLPYYLAFLKAFPTVFDLAAAEEEKVLKLWQGLGYYSRARNLHTTAKYVVNELDGIFPNTYKELLTLKGVGDYTASAIASICYNEVVPVVDGNVYRVLSRYFNVDTPINTTIGIKEFKKLAIEVVDHQEPATYNQAIMEFGALQCKPQNPDCMVCPLQDSCEGLKSSTVHQLPIKLKKTKVTKKHFNYIVLDMDNGHTVMQKRTGKGIWKNLYEFPLIETSTELTIDEIKKHEGFTALIQDRTYEISLYNDDVIIHKLSHQHLYTRFYIVSVSDRIEDLERYQIISSSTIKQYPVPILIGNFIDRFFKIEV